MHRLLSPHAALASVGDVVLALLPAPPAHSLGAVVMTGSGFMDVNDAQEYAALMRQAHQIHGAVEEHVDGATVEDFDEWLVGIGLEGTLARELDDDGCVIWVLKIQTGRGTLTRRLYGAGDWRTAVEDMGLA